MEFHIVYHASVVSKHVDLLAVVCHIPDSHGFIVTARGYHPRISRKLRAFYPILMSRESLQETMISNVPHFDKLIIGGRNKHSSISIELNGFDWCWMTLKNNWLSRRRIIPDTNGIISRAARNKRIWRVDAHIVNWPKMSLKLVCSRIGFQACGQNHTVHRTGNNLFHVVTKDALGNGIPVLFEGLH